MDPILLALLVTLLAGAATVVGGVAATTGRLRTGAGLAASLAFAAGAMITISVVEIVPKGAADLGLALTLALVVLGAGVVFVVQRAVPRAADAPDAALDTDFQRTRLRRSGLIVALVVAGHNLPEGLVTFAATVDEPAAGIAIAIAIAIHNVPEGVAVAAPVHAATGSRAKAITYATGSGLAEPIGGLLGYLLLAAILPEAALGAVFGLIAGMMLQISAAELLPAARALAGARTVTTAAAVGGATMVVSLVLLAIA